MFVLSMKLKKKRVFSFLTITVLLLVLVGSTVAYAKGRKEDAGKALKTADVSNNEKRLAFIKSLGWDVDKEPIEISEVIIPPVFDETYESYNNLQKRDGYDLTRLMGKRVKRYSYDIKNYPGGQKRVRINLLVYDGKLVGGDVSSQEQGGFMHGFTMEQ